MSRRENKNKINNAIHVIGVSLSEPHIDDIAVEFVYIARLDQPKIKIN